MGKSIKSDKTGGKRFTTYDHKIGGGKAPSGGKGSKGSITSLVNTKDHNGGDYLKK